MLCARMIWSHSPDYSQNCTLLSHITITNPMNLFINNSKKRKIIGRVVTEACCLRQGFWSDHCGPFWLPEFIKSLQIPLLYFYLTIKDNSQDYGLGIILNSHVCHEIYPYNIKRRNPVENLVCVTSWSTSQGGKQFYSLHCCLYFQFTV